MNRWEKEVQQSLLDSEESALKELEAQYARALRDINEKVKGFQADIDLLDEALSQDGLDDATRALLQSQKRSKVYQQQYQKALQGQVSGILDKLHGDNYATIEGYLKGCYDDGYIGTMYDISRQGVPVIAPIDQAAAVKAILTDSKVSNGLYNALGVDVAKLKKTITQEISRGIASSLPYRDIARNIGSVSGAPLSRAKTIARTEGHRIQQMSTVDAQQAAKAKGADVVKQWDATLDGRTRDSHRRVDGEIRELDEKFSNGLMFPGDPSGGAAEVVNCRCTSNTRARWALGEEELQTLKERAEYFGLDKTKSFDDFKEKYLKAADEVKNQEEAVQRIADKLGIDKKAVKLDGLPADAQQSIFDSVSQSIDRFPQLKGHIKGITYKEDLESIASSKSLTGQLFVSGKYKDMEQFAKNYDYCVKLKYFPKGTSASSVLTHEIGHQLDGLFTLKGLDGGEVGKYGTIRTSQAVQKEVLSRLGLTDERLRDIRKEYAAKGYTGKDLTHAVMFERKEFITNHVSEYAATNEKEFFAECYSEYMTSKEPREAARIFGEILERLVGELK